MCDGSDPTVILNLGCVVPMSTFWLSTPFNLPFGQVVAFTIAARNVRGWGQTSDPNT